MSSIRWNSSPTPAMTWKAPRASSIATATSSRRSTRCISSTTSTSCAYVAFAPDPKKFGSPRDAGCYFGLTAGQDQSGDIDKPRNITKGGNEMMRRLLVTAANYILRESSKDSALKRYGERICARGGKIARRKAKIAVARKLAVVMMAMLQSRRPYQDNLAARQETVGPAGV